jgi:serine phosphatase RsbU (regulator of sigma subunit)/anti-sigma regulatory factor (Ser/Thr protein kinase)
MSRPSKRKQKEEKTAKPANKRMRTYTFIVLAVVSACLCFSQLGDIVLVGDLSSDLNLLLFLLPVVLCIVLLGAASGIVLALITGILIMLRCWWTSSTLFDIHLSDPLLSIVSITVAAALMAAIVRPATRHWPENHDAETSKFRRINSKRIIATILGCLVFAFVFSYGARGLIYLFVQPGGDEYDYATIVAGYIESLSGPFVFGEALLNGCIMSILSIATIIFKANVQSDSWMSKLNVLFNACFALAMILVFLIASSVSFCVETVSATNDADSTLLSELEYLNQQVDERLKAGTDISSVATGFHTAYGGTVVIIYDDVIVSSNDPTQVGNSGRNVLQSGNKDNFDHLFEQVCQYMLTGYDNETGSFSGVRGLRGDNGYLFVIDSPLEAVYKARTATLLYNACFLLAMQIVVIFVAHRLLRRIVVKPIHRTNDTLELITEGDLERRVDEHKVVEFDSLSTGINTTVSALGDTVSALGETIIEIEHRNEVELATAKAIQESALPRTFPPFPEIESFDIYASMNAAKEVGGDFYDFFLIDERTLGFLIADVSGKGIPGALFMMAAKTQVENYMTTGMDLAQAILCTNRHLCANNDAGMFVTVWAATLDYWSGKLTYVNAGHNPPLLRHEGSWSWLTKRGGLFLGTFETAKYRSSELTLRPGDQLLLYTDGVNEAFSVNDEEYGNDRLEAFLSEHTTLRPRELTQALRADVAAWAEGAEQSDDITILTLEFGQVAERRDMISVPADIAQLVQVHAFMHEELNFHEAPKAVFSALDVAVEELFCNVCNYAYPDATPENPGEVCVGLHFDDDEPSVTITLSDEGVPFNPLEKPREAVQAGTEADNLPVGGLGILIAERSVDGMEYERTGSNNVLTLHKSW